MTQPHEQHHSMTRTYVAALALEAVVLLGLWFIARIYEG